MTVNGGTTYRLRFDAESISGKDVKLNVHRHTSHYTNYGLNGHVVDLTSSWQHHEVTFTASNVTSTNGRLRIKFSNVDNFYFDNVLLVPASGNPSSRQPQRQTRR